jgi:L-fuconolactonase
MDAVGVHAAVIATSANYRERLPNGLFRYCNLYAELAHRRHPDRFASITHIDHRLPDIDDQVAEIRNRPGTLAIRKAFREEDLPELRGGGYAKFFDAAAKHSVPVFVYIAGHLSDALPIARDNPNLLLIIDHFGLVQPPLQHADSPPWARLPELLALAVFPNVAVKFCGAPTLSQQGYPYRDVWPYLHSVIKAFGGDRLMWASDFTRCWSVNTYAQGLYFLRYTDELSENEKKLLLGATARRLLRWPQVPETEPEELIRLRRRAKELEEEQEVYAARSLPPFMRST